MLLQTKIDDTWAHLESFQITITDDEMVECLRNPTKLDRLIRRIAADTARLVREDIEVYNRALQNVNN